jgi:hypothetical protein
MDHQLGISAPAQATCHIGGKTQVQRHGCKTLCHTASYVQSPDSDSLYPLFFFLCVAPTSLWRSVYRERFEPGVVALACIPR